MIGDAFVLASGRFLTMTAGKWDLTSFLTNSTTTLESWFKLGSMLIGLVMVGVAIWQIASGLMSHGKKQTNWGISILLLIVGGALSLNGGFKLFQDIAQGGKTTIEQLGTPTTTTLMMLDYMRAWLNL